jgi:trk system potassium uptake protein TrkH
MKILNFKLIRYIFGLLLLMEATFLALATGVAGYYHWHTGDDDLVALGVPTLLTAVVGVILLRTGQRRADRFTQKDGFFIVAAAWVLFSLFGMLPYLIYGTTTSVADAFFETMSGFTTTGATMLENIDTQPHGILFWRSLTQWIGGLGIVVFSLALLPLIGTGCTQMFNAEVTGLSVDKLRPKIQNTSRRLWAIYLGLTGACALCFYAGDMGTYDAVCHALTTMSTGGFSTHQASIGYFQSSYLEYVCAAFLFVGSLNFSLFYMVGIGKWKHFWRNEEFRWFVFLVLGFTVLFMVLQGAARAGLPADDPKVVAIGTGAESTFRTALFHTLTIVSSAGFQGSHFDYVAWGGIFWIPTLFLMACGGCAGSTAGGLKVIRLIVLLKSSRNEFDHQIHPRAVTSVRLGGHAIASEMVQKILAFLFVYLLLVVVCTFLLQCMGVTFDTAIGTTISAFGNTGPGLGDTGPSGTWIGLPTAAKWLMSFAMLVGRLEIFTVILLFSPTFWQK